jgi:hypothetical protein
MLGDKYQVHLIYYDENITNSENIGYVNQFKNKIEGAFFPVGNIESLRKLVNKLNSIQLDGSCILVTSGSAAEKSIPICSNLVSNIIIFCFYKEKYLPLKDKYPKIISVLNSFDNIFSSLHYSNIFIMI